LLRWQSETISISIVSVPLLVSTFENSPYALPVLFRLKYFSVFAEFNLCKFVAGLHVAACQNKVDFNVVKLTKKRKKNWVSSFLPSAATFIKKYCIVYIDGEEEGK